MPNIILTQLCNEKLSDVLRTISYSEVSRLESHVPCVTDVFDLLEMLQATKT